MQFHRQWANWGVGAILAAALSLPALAEEPRLPATPAQYWQYILKAREQAEESAGRKGDDAETQKHTYLFEAFQGLECETMIEAATWAIRSAETDRKGQPQPVIDSHIRANLMLCLEYYPIAAKRTDDYTRLLDVIGDGEHPAPLRNFLLEQVNPPDTAQTLLGDYISDRELRNRYDLGLALKTIVRRSQEDEQVQLGAARAWFRIAYADYRKAFDDTSVVKGLNAKRNTPLTPADVVAGEQVAFDKRAMTLLERLARECRSIASECVELLHLGNTHSPEFTAAIRALIDEILAGVPVSTPEEIRARIAAIDAAP
ncbi:MAG: hypothetical protein HYV27_22615 [Candidatus Hydrogenedentes bacterium]|nr:hypothetical protein [Candidatus Hydrogenedentota bacterium]